MHSDEFFQASHTPFDFSKYETPYEDKRIKILKGLIPLGYGRSAIDIGCGPGYFTRELSIKDWRTTAIDTDSQNIENAKRYSLQTQLGDALGILMTFPESHYGLVLALEIIEHMPKTYGKQLLVEVNRVLAPNAKLIISTPNKYSPEGLKGYYYGEKIAGWGKWFAWDPTHVNIYSSFEIIRLLKTVGFTIDRIIGYHYEGIFPMNNRGRPLLIKSERFPFNLLGFNIIVECHKNTV